MNNSISFEGAVNELTSLMNSISIEYDKLRVETQVESFKDWSLFGDIDELLAWYARQKSACTMLVSDIPLGECRGWFLDKDSGHIVHTSGDFFKVQGVRIENSSGREVSSGWDQPIITQIGFDGGLLGLLRKRFSGVPHYLIEAKAEPGNPDLVQISPTLQATFSNLRRAHQGRKPHFAEYFEAPEDCESEILFSQWMSEDGGRLHLKRNKGMLVEVGEHATLPAFPDTFRWVSLYQLKHLIKSNSWVNPHIRGILSHL